MGWFERKRTGREGQRENRPFRGDERRQRLAPAARRRAHLDPRDPNYPASTSAVDQPTILADGTRLPSQRERARAAGRRLDQPLPGNHRQRRDARRRASQLPGEEARGRAASAQRNVGKHRLAAVTGMFSGLLGAGRGLRPEHVRAAHKTVTRVVSAADGHRQRSGGGETAQDWANALLKAGADELVTATTPKPVNTRGRARATYARTQAQAETASKMREGAKQAGDLAVADAKQRGITDRTQLAQIRRQARYDFGRNAGPRVGEYTAQRVHKHAHTGAAKRAGRPSLFAWIGGKGRGAVEKRVKTGVQSGIHARIDAIVPPTKANGSNGNGRNGKH